MTTDDIAPATGAKRILRLDASSFLSGTLHLSLEQTGAFGVLMIHIRMAGNQEILDDPDRAARAIGCTKRKWLKTFRPVLLPLFTCRVGEA